VVSVSCSKRRKSDEAIERDYLVAKLFGLEVIAFVLRLFIIAMCTIMGMWTLGVIVMLGWWTIPVTIVAAWLFGSSSQSR
jgi:uncharacterized membrane protein